MDNTLPPKERVLKSLQYFCDKLGYSPSIRELCYLARVSSTSVMDYYLDQLQEEGSITGHRSGKARTIRPVKQEQQI